MKFFVRTFGCQMNENDSEHIAGVLAAAGGEEADGPEDADLVVINTCAVRAKSEEKLFSYLGRLSSIKRKRPILIGVAGCVAQVRRAALLRERPFIDFVVGPDNYRDLPLIAARAASGPCFVTGRTRAWREFGPGETLRESASPAFVTVMEGCNSFCAYCVVPFSRGREKFRPLASVLREVRELAESGSMEIQFLGQNVNSYRDPESGRGLDALLDLAGAVPGPAWLRFITSHPAKFGPGLIAAMARNPKVCRSLHLPLQSGSTAVLRRMNRGYGREEYLDLVSRLREALPGLLLTTDIIVGFPGETEDDFEATLDALRRVRFAGIFSFRYSPRPLTAAARLADDVPLEAKRRRLLELQALQKTIQAEVLRSFVGRELDVLVTGPSPKGGGRFSGRSEGNLVVNFAAPRVTIGAFAAVRITGSGPYSLHGELVSQI
ncbi:MAG TPA: tRNA (N6-isopentenyl adenosine(37)-C2)-methylthiotransferase MiaB [Terriglobales bacterium]|nr:tRNA (N6-isopentenyl adenosine(37)-C2)-methylthiotransferase MiaB [Terriglobales bacterium]